MKRLCSAAVSKTDTTGLCFSPASSDVIAQMLNLRTVYSFVFHFRCIKLYSGLVTGTHFFYTVRGFSFWSYSCQVNLGMPNSLGPRRLKIITPLAFISHTVPACQGLANVSQLFD